MKRGYIGSLLTAEEKRAQIAYERIVRRNSIKSIAADMKMNEKTVEYHWFEARKQIKKCAL